MTKEEIVINDTCTFFPRDPKGDFLSQNMI